MPITISLTKGLLTPQGEREIHTRITAALLDVHGLAGNEFLTQTISGHVHVHPQECSFVGGKPQSLAIIEIKAPSVTFPNQEVKDHFVKQVTDLVDELKAGTHPRERTFVNVTHTLDGAWGIAGRAYTSQALEEGIRASTH